MEFLPFIHLWAKSKSKIMLFFKYLLNYFLININSISFTDCIVDVNHVLEIQYQPPEVLVKDNATKSNSIYEDAYNKFKEWCKLKNVINYSENELLEYFSELGNKYRWTSELLSHYSMLKSTLHNKHGIDTSKFLKLQLYFDDLNKVIVQPKEFSRVFTRDNIEKFLLVAPDDKYLLMKVIFFHFVICFSIHI